MTDRTAVSGQKRPMSDPHAHISPTTARERGCTCEFGCRACGMSEAQMGNCPSFYGCPMGRAADPNCPLLRSDVLAEKRPHAG